MKYIFITSLLLFVSCQLSAQSLEGEWQGYFNTAEVTNQGRTFIALTIKSAPDSSYEIYSYTKLKTTRRTDTTVICHVSYEDMGDKKIKLQEYSSENGSIITHNRQTMFLKIKEKKGKKFLTGNWVSYTNNIFGIPQKSRGRISFTRVGE